METHSLKTSGGRCYLRLLSLYASNFKKLKFKQALNFTDGIILITGLNESGKSTVLDAILYGLFGRMIRPTQKPSDDDILSYGSGEAQVRLEFAVAEKRYRVVREVHRTRVNTAHLYELGYEGQTKTIATTVNTTTSEVERLLGGITYNEIVASSVVAQKDLERLIKQRLDDRRKVINVFLNLDSFNRVQDQLAQERVRIEGTPKNPGQLTLQRQTLETLNEKLRDYEEKEDQLGTLQDKSKKLAVELRELEKKFQETDVLHKTLTRYDEALKLKESLEREVRDKTTLRDNLQERLAGITSTRSELERLEAQLSEFEELSNIERRMTQASRLVDELGELELRRDQLSDQARQFATEIAQKGGSHPISVSVSKPRRGSSRVWAYLATTGALGAGTVLSFFLLPLAALAFGSLAVVSLILLARQIASLSQEADSAGAKRKEDEGLQLIRLREKDLADVKQSFSTLVENVSSKSQEILSLLNTISGYSNVCSGNDDPEAVFNLVSSAYEHDKQTQRSLREKTEFLRRELQEEPAARERLAKTDEEIQQVTNKLAMVEVPDLPEGMVFSKELLTEASGYRDSLNEQVSRVRTQIEEAADRQAELRSFLDENMDLGEKVEAQNRKVLLLEREVAVVKYAMKGLEATSESLRNRVKPQVERYMGLILPVITSGHYKAVQLDDDYTVKVFDPEAGEFRPREVFSGGTEDQLLLSMRLAFALALIPQVKGQSPEFLFLDEPLGSSDKVRREGILALLRKELAQNFRQIFLISHVGDLEAEADTIIQMENGTVREVVGHKPSSLEQVQVPA